MVGVWKENSDKCSRIAAETSTPIKVGQRRSRVGVYSGRSANEGYKSSWWSSSKSVSAWEESVEAPPGLARQITTGKTVDPVVKCLTQILQEKDVQAKMDAEGYVSIQWLLKVKSALSWECGGNAKSLISAIESQVGIQLDEAHRRVRLRSCCEQLLVEAKRLMQQLPFGVVPLSSFFGLPSLSQMQKCSELDAEGLLRKALTRDSELVIQGAFVAWQPRAEKLRKSVEQLFLEQDSQLHSKIQQSGDVPLTWIVGRYAEKLGLAHSNVRTSEALAEAVAGALQDSQVLRVDRHRLTVRKCRSPERAPEDPRSGETDRQEGGERRGGRAASQLRQLLDFYFEPFTLQHNRYLLDLILKRADAPQDKGPWRVEALQNCRFTWEDLQGLGRIQSALTKLQSRPDGMVELRDLKHLSCDDGQFHLRTKLEVRNFVHAENVSKDVAGAAVRYLTASREQQQEAPKGVVNVMSYAVAEMMTDQSPAGQQRLAKVKRQILVYRTDLICLQGLDANEKIGANLATSLVEEGYGLASSKVTGEANCILWDRRRWDRVREDVTCDALAVELKPYEDPETSIRVVCWRANVHNDSSRLFGAHEKVLVCTDLSSAGGAEAAGIVDELVGLPSVAEEVLGEEVAAHIPAPPGLSLDDCDCELAPVRSQGLNRLRHPDAVFFLNMTPVTALSGHTAEYLEKMPQEDVVQQFPCFRLPIVAAFDWQNSDWAGAKRAPSHADHVRL